MATYIQTAEKASLIYMTKTELDALKKASAELSVTIKQINQLGQSESEIGQKCKSLFLRVQTKILLIEYFNGGFYPDEKDTALGFFAQEKEDAQSHGWGKTVTIMQKAEDYIRAVDGIMYDAAAIYDSVRGRNDECLTSSVDVLMDIGAQFKAKRAAAEQLESVEEIFGTGVKMPDLKGGLIADLDEMCAWCVKNIDAINNKDVAKFFDENTKVMEDGATPTHHPSVMPDSYTSAGVIVLNTPFADEAYMGLRCYAKEHKVSFRIVTGMALSSISIDDIKRLFEVFADRKTGLIVEDLNKYRNDKSFDLLAAEIISLGKKGVRVFVTDSGGDRSVYDRLLEFVRKTDGFSALDVSNVFMCMPPCNEFMLALASVKLIDHGAVDPYVTAKMKFAGYVGLNEILDTAMSGGSWKNVGVEISSRREERAREYLSKLPSQLQLLDLGWGEETNYKRVDDTETHKAFDYDEVTTVNPENLKRIVDNPELSIFEKCGGISLYCTLCGMDKSVWPTIPDDERTKRINTATKLVAHILSTTHVPEVTIVSKEEMDKRAPKAGGLCVDGGKAILYRTDCVDSIDWIVDAICHEAFHSFQHTAVDTGFKRWYFTELGVTEGRIDRWKNNFSMYEGDVDSVTYKVEIVESDAVAFEKDCSAVALKALMRVQLV